MIYGSFLISDDKSAPTSISTSAGAAGFSSMTDPNRILGPTMEGLW
jgi:hypothetical protein